MIEMKDREIILERFVKKEEEGLYFPVEFQVPEQVEELEIIYEYERFSMTENDQGETVREEKNIVDLAVCAAHGNYVGSSGSDRNRILLSPYGSSQGFAALDIEAGTWQIILGAYKIEEKGCRVIYRVIIHQKQMRLYKGDTHVHTTGSDGNCDLNEIAWLSKKAGLDYVFITDHNNYAHNEQLPMSEGLTVIPGAEWTHYKGHAGMLGIKKPFDNPFCVNREEEMKEKLHEAKIRGAGIVLNHPFCPSCGWKWGLERAEYDLIEIWNGGTLPAANRKCLDWWDAGLKEGKRIPVIGGSDFHKAEYLRMPASPCTCVYAGSRTGEDILAAMIQGHSFIVYQPDGPMAEGEADGALFGDMIPEGTEVRLHFWKLREGDRILLITDKSTEEITVQKNVTEMRCSRKVGQIKYLRAEIWRDSCAAGQMPALLTNPFYIEKQRN